MTPAEQSLRTSCAGSHGSVLVAVLGITALIMVLVLGVLSLGRDGTQRDRIVADGMETEALARLPAQIIATQLQRATTQVSSAAGKPLLWASQPGMIRVYGTDVPEGKDRAKAEMHYRLYSAPVMNSAVLDAAKEAADLGQWAAQPAGYTDLNEPVSSTRSGSSQVFPIADPRALGVVEGFSMRVPAPGADTVRHPLPMPSAWIYLLKDGRMVMPDSMDETSATFSPAVVTRLNPVVGRIAFWTDDESCKLNLNTASEAAAWDVPRANTRTERGYAAMAPAAAEYHRMSGHPAFTSLSPVFQGLGKGSASAAQRPQPDPFDPLDRDGSSLWLRYQNCYQALAPHGAGMPWTPASTARQDRHYASVDEFVLDPVWRGNGGSAGFVVDPADLKMAKFFLTTRSSAPDLNPFGGPKVALWSQPQDAAMRTDTDWRISQSSALNASLGDADRHEFAFQRFADWTSPASQGSSQSATDDWSQVPRNRELYAWLQSMTASVVPGYGGRFVDKYGAMSRDQILTSMFDMMRWGVNSPLPPPPGPRNPQGLAEQSTVPLRVGGATSTGQGFGRFPTLTEVAVVFAFTDVERTPDGLPLDANHDGICDRASKLRAFMVVNPFVPAAGSPAVSPAWTLHFQVLMHWWIGAGVTLNLPGGNVISRCQLSSSLPLIDGQPWSGHASAYAGFASQFLQADGSPRLIGRRDDPAQDFPFISLTDVALGVTDGRPGSGLKFSGGNIVVDLLRPEAPVPGGQPSANDVIQSIELAFPSCLLPMPSLAVQDFAAGPRSLEDRFRPRLMSGEVRLPIIQKGDVVRSMVLNPEGPSHGDVRLLAARPSITAAGGWFVPHADYGTTTPVDQLKAEAQSLRDGAYMLTGQYGTSGSGGGPRETALAGGRLLPGVTFAPNAIPAVPALLNGALQPAVGTDVGGRLGDWESGGGLLEDGPFVSRSASAPGGWFSRGAPADGNASGMMEPVSLASSAVMFGALPSGMYGGRLNAVDKAVNPTPRPWQTLLFCPNPAGRVSPASLPGRFDNEVRDHFGFASPPDHLWLEFFWMPVTAPWALTRGFATEGKVNMNFQLMPYSWIHRATAMHGAMKGVRVTAVPTCALMGAGPSAKGHDDGTPLDTTFRYEINADKTLAAFEQRFDAGEIFRTPSDICEMYLVPKRIAGQGYDVGGRPVPDPANLEVKDMAEWWNGASNDPADAFEATGDNLREAPYAALHPRLCTQSNVYRVHYRVQLLRKSRTTRADVWDESRDIVAGERRGSDVIERRYSPASGPVADPATPTGQVVSLHVPQKFNIIERCLFTP
ncbi:MAG: Verru Chthon cassette protein [Verrucomicrobiaceae bacterium]|nr:Verru Chthon cassette protein [Verrucomicrobiaceae bacterium]